MMPYERIYQHSNLTTIESIDIESNDYRIYWYRIYVDSMIALFQIEGATDLIWKHLFENNLDSLLLILKIGATNLIKNSDFRFVAPKIKNRCNESNQIQST